MGRSILIFFTGAPKNIKSLLQLGPYFCQTLPRPHRIYHAALQALFVNLLAGTDNSIFWYCPANCSRLITEYLQASIWLIAVFKISGFPFIINNCQCIYIFSYHTLAGKIHPIGIRKSISFLAYIYPVLSFFLKPYFHHIWILLCDPWKIVNTCWNHSGIHLNLRLSRILYRNPCCPFRKTDIACISFRKSHCPCNLIGSHSLNINSGIVPDCIQIKLFSIFCICNAAHAIINFLQFLQASAFQNCSGRYVENSGKIPYYIFCCPYFLHAFPGKYAKQK